MDTFNGAYRAALSELSNHKEKYREKKHRLVQQIMDNSFADY